MSALLKAAYLKALLYILWKLFPNYYKPIENSSYALTLTFSLFLSTFFSVMMKANSFTMWMNVCLAENSIRILSLNSLWAYFFSNNFQIWEKIAFALKQTLKQKKANFRKALSRPRGNHNQPFKNCHSEPSNLISKHSIKSNHLNQI